MSTTPRARSTDAQTRLEEARRQLPTRGLMARPKPSRAWRRYRRSRRARSSPRRSVLEYHGVTAWTLPRSRASTVLQRALRPAAAGERHGPDPVHDRLGFDHRNAVGRRGPSGQRRGPRAPRLISARAASRSSRSAGRVAGASTGAHVHVGAPSPRHRLTPSSAPRAARRRARGRGGAGGPVCAWTVVPDMLQVHEGQP